MGVWGTTYWEISPNTVWIWNRTGEPWWITKYMGHGGQVKDPKHDELIRLKDAPTLKTSAEYGGVTMQYADGSIEEFDGWTVRLNGYKFPRPRWDFHSETWDWLPKYATPNTPQGKQEAINLAIRQSGHWWGKLLA